MLNDCLLGGDGKKTSVNKGLMLQLFPKLAAICFIGKAWDIQMSHIFLSFSQRIKPQFVRLVFLLFKSFNWIYTHRDKLCSGIEINGVSHSAAHACLNHEKSTAPR